MLETTNLRSSIPVGTCFFCENKNFEYFRLSCLLFFVGLGLQKGSVSFKHFESSL